MIRRTLAHVVGILVVSIPFTTTPALAQGPEGVSPGETDRVTEVEGRCPSFFWSGIPGATAYELVVY